MADRWGIAGANWRQVREIRRGEDDARKWARSLSTGRYAERITLYRDSGDGWMPVQVFYAPSDAAERGTGG